MVLNDSLFAQIKWFRPPSKIYGELCMGYGLATTFIYTGVSSILLTDSALSFLPNLDASEMPFPSSSQSPNTPMHTTNIK